MSKNKKIWVETIIVNIIGHKMSKIAARITRNKEDNNNFLQDKGNTQSKIVKMKRKENQIQYLSTEYKRWYNYLNKQKK